MSLAPRIRDHRDYVISIVFAAAWVFALFFTAAIAVINAVAGNLGVTLVEAGVALYSAANVASFVRSIRTYRQEIR